MSAATGTGPSQGPATGLAELTDAARRGDRAAFEQLVVITSPDVYALARRLLGDSQDARDVVQEVYLRAFRSIGRFRGEASVTSWLYRITANCCSSHLSRRRFTRHLPLDDGLPIVDLRAEAALEAAEVGVNDRERLRAALDALPAALRLVVVLHDVYDLPHEGIARELGISRTASKVRLHRARKRLRDLLLPAAPGAAPLERQVAARQVADPQGVGRRAARM